jgi:thioredoxin-like negative regulator of GroEL
LPPLIRFRQLQSKLKDNIDDLNTLNEFIRLGYKLGEFEPIEDSMRRYLARHPRHNATRYSLAMLLIRSGKREKAPKELRKILQYNPKFHQARQLLERMRKKEI